MSKRLRRVARLGLFLAAVNVVLWFGAPTVRDMIDTAYERIDHPSRPVIINGVQEALVYVDPWYCWWAMPAVFIVAFACIPMFVRPKPLPDTDAGGQGTIGFYSLLTTCLLVFFEAVYLFLFYVGVAMRGPNWNLYAIGEKWDARLEVLNNLNLSEFFWRFGVGKGLPEPWLVRESPGIVAGLVYFAAGVLLARWLGKRHPSMQSRAWMAYIAVFQVAAILPLKMVCRWMFDLRYFVAIPELYFNV